MAYQVELTRSAARQLRSLPRDTQVRLRDSIRKLADNPRPDRAVKLTGQDLYRIRVGDYRVVYQVRDDVLLVLVVRLGHRRDVYR
jgi:mRNA interferase RelE/StbE